MLTLGMALRAVKRVQFTDPDYEGRGNWPEHVSNSPLGFDEFQELQDVAKNLANFFQVPELPVNSDVQAG